MIGGRNIGSLSFRALATLVLERTDFNFQSRPYLPNRVLGELGDPRWTGNFYARWESGGFGIDYRLRYISSQLQSGVLAEEIFTVGGVPPLNPDVVIPIV